MQQNQMKLAYQQNKYRIAFPNQLAELQKVVQDRFQIKDFSLVYFDGEDDIQIANEEDFEIAIEFFQGKQFEVKVNEQSQYKLRRRKTDLTDLQIPNMFLQQKTTKSQQNLDQTSKGDTTPLNRRAKFTDIEFPTQAQPGQKIHLKFKLKNTGDEDWPKNVRIKNTNAKDLMFIQALRSLRPQESESIKIMLLTPMNVGPYMYQFRLCFEQEENEDQWFGPRLEVDIVIKSAIEDRHQEIRMQLSKVIDMCNFDINTNVNQYLNENPEASLDQVLASLKH